MHLGKLCKYARECPVYQKKIKPLGNLLFWCETYFATGGTKAGTTVKDTLHWKPENR